MNKLQTIGAICLGVFITIATLANMQQQRQIEDLQAQLKSETQSLHEKLKELRDREHRRGVELLILHDQQQKEIKRLNDRRIK